MWPLQISKWNCESRSKYSPARHKNIEESIRIYPVEILIVQNNSISDGAISQLMALGFSNEQCISALRRADGNLERASNILLDGG
jgi:hypothetical protein